MPYTQVCVHLVITWSIILLIANLLTPLGAAVNVLIAVTAPFLVIIVGKGAVGRKNLCII